MATINASGSSGPANTANLSTAQTGNADSTNVVDTGRSLGAALLKITSTVGATPTVTVNIQGSRGRHELLQHPLRAESGTPTTVTVAALTITTATTSYYYLQANYPWRYLKLVYSRQHERHAHRRLPGSGKSGKLT